MCGHARASPYAFSFFLASRLKFNIEFGEKGAKGKGHDTLFVYRSRWDPGIPPGITPTESRFNM